jgi:hypothetical protein
MKKKTVVLGASPNPARYAYAAVRSLKNLGHEVVALGIRNGVVEGLPILHGQPAIDGVDTVTLYLNPAHQVAYYDYLLALHPRRIIFNPGSENPELMRLARERGIGVEVGCTLVMLAIGNY